VAATALGGTCAARKARSTLSGSETCTSTTCAELLGTVVASATATDTSWASRPDLQLRANTTASVNPHQRTPCIAAGRIIRTNAEAVESGRAKENGATRRRSSIR
jgi:hypothetical protein